MPYPKDCWLLAVDERRAMILQNEGDDCYPNFRIVKGYEQHVFQRHMTMEGDSPLPKEQFLRNVAAYIESDCVLGCFTSLIIAARPAIMVELMRAMSPRLKQFIAAQILEDLLNQPLEHIERRIRGVCASQSATHATQVLVPPRAA